MGLPNFSIPTLSKRSTTIGAAVAAAFTAAVVYDGVVMTSPDQVKMILSAGSPSRFTSEGLGFKIPFYQSTYTLKTSVQEIDLPKADIALQNGTVTAEKLESSAFYRLNGTREEREETVKLIRGNMPDLDEKIKTLAETALRNTVRLTVIASAEDSETQGVTSQRHGEINFLDSKAVGVEIEKKLQEDINRILPGTVNVVGRGDVPRLEIVQFRISNFNFDHDYLDRRKRIADSRAGAEAARFKKAESEREADADAAKGGGKKRYTVTVAEGEAQATELRQAAEAKGLKLRIESAGGAENLRAQTLAERWGGATPQVVGGQGVIVDGRYAPGVRDITALPALRNSGPQ